MLIMLYALYCLRNMRVLMPHPEIVRHKEKAEEALASLRSATTSGELRDAWEDFLGAFARTLGRLIKFAMETERTRAWAHRLKNASQKDNDVLVYLREARNSAEHGLEPQFATKPRTSTLGGFLDFEEGSSGNVHIESCSFEGVAVGLLKAEVEDGLVKEQIGDTVLPVGVSAAEITLQPIINEEKRLTVPLPQKLDDIDFTSQSPEELASHALAVIASLIDEYDRLTEPGT